MDLKHIMEMPKRGYLNYADDRAAEAFAAWARELLPFPDLWPDEQDRQPAVKAARERLDAIRDAIDSYERGEGY